MEQLKKDGWGDPSKVERYGHYRPLSQKEEDTHLNFMNGLSVKDIDWGRLALWLPCKKNVKDKKRRKEIFDLFDPNGNGYLSLAEIDKGF